VACNKVIRSKFPERGFAYSVKLHSMLKYIFHAAATAAHYEYGNTNEGFGHEYSAVYKGHTPFQYQNAADKREGPISFSSTLVFIECKQEDGAYRTIARSGLKDFKVSDSKGNVRVAADYLEVGIETVYRSEWFEKKKKRRHARILPLRPVITNLTVCGEPYEIKLPKAFLLEQSDRDKYFLGEGPEKNPVGISSEPGKSFKTSCGVIQATKDTRRITIPKFGKVEFADWVWLEPDIHIPPKTAQWIQLVRLNLKNPGNGGGGGVGGNGTT